ncbi:MAG TPA: hypothetical protein VMU18_07700 [Rhodoblastus sp.]|nr:hypothetical protein [Rhodoblastus sp.]
MRELPYLLIIALAMAGVVWTSLSHGPSTRYWVAMTPVCALICVVEGWPSSLGRSEKLRLAATQVVQWLGVLIAMYLIAVSDVRGVLSDVSTGLMMLTLLALGVFVSGLYLGAWRLGAAAVFLALSVPVIAWVERAALLLVLIGAAVIAVGLLYWWMRGRQADASA